MEKKNLQGVELTDKELEEVSGGGKLIQLAHRVCAFLGFRTFDAVSSNAIDYTAAKQKAGAHGVEARKVAAFQSNKDGNKW